MVWITREAPTMRTALKLVGVAVLATLLSNSASLAVAVPVQTSPIASEVELVREERGGSRAASTKAWLRKKKNQTANWMGRQKRKLQNLVD